MENTRRLRRDLGYEVAKLHGLQQTFDRAPDDAGAKALATQIRVQAGICLKVLDDYQSSVGSRMWSDAERMCRPFRDQLRRTESQFRSNAGEWDGGTRGRASLQRSGTWMWDDFYESTGDADESAGDEVPDGELASRVMVAPPLQAAAHIHDDLDLLLALFDDEERDGALAIDARRDVTVAPRVRAEVHPHEDLGPPAALVDDEEPDGALAIDARRDVTVAPRVRAEVHPHEDLGPPAALVDDEEPDGATAVDAASGVIVAPPVPPKARRREDPVPPTALLDEDEPVEGTAVDPTSDMTAPPVQPEAHPRTELGTPTPSLDDETPDGATANDALRFTLPTGGGSGEQTMLVLVPRKTGLVYGHQYGGLQCHYAEIEGFLVPAWVNPETRAGLDRLFLVDLGGNGVREKDRSEAVDRVRDAVRHVWYRGTGERMAPLQVDDTRAGELDEAWVPVLTPDGPAYLAWSNSD